MRRLRFGRFGLAENPIGAHVVWTIGEREYLAEVVGVKYNHIRGYAMLKTRHFCGDDAPDVSAAAVYVLERDYEAAE